MAWLVLGLLLFLAGCRAAITAEKLEASITISRVDLVEPGQNQENRD